MNDSSWNCAGCGIPNSTALSECRNCKTPRTLTTERLLEKNAVVESRVIYVFLGVFQLLALIVAAGLTNSLFFGAAAAVVTWWAGLACFAAAPIGGEFRRERQFLSRLLDEQTSVAGRRAVQCLFYGLYWPIFISKNAYFIFTVGAVAIYYGAKFLHTLGITVTMH